MTHGCGTVSSGGGGFSGGGASMSTVLIAGAQHSSRRRNSRRHGDTDCCCAVCWLIAFLLCLVKVPPKTRIVLTWIWVITAAVTSAILVKQHSFADDQLSDSPWDMRQLYAPTSFCSSVSIMSSDPIDVYNLPFSPKVQHGTIRTSSPQYSSYIGYNSYEYWGFYFIEGSSVSAKIMASGSQLDFYVIKGKSNLDKWIDNADCSDCYWYSTTVAIGTFGYTASFEFSETDQYYFLFSNVYIDFRGADLYVGFHLNRTVYDVTGGVRDCHDLMSCTVDLDLASSSSVVIDVPKDSSNDLGILVTCNPRVYLYVIVFGMVPTFIGICISLGIYKYSKRGTTTPSRTTPRREGVSNRVYTLSGDELNSIANVNQAVSPPSYMDKPPSYQEAVNSA